MDQTAKEGLQKAKLLEGEKEFTFFEKVQNSHWVVQSIVALIILYSLFFKTTCKVDGTPEGCWTFWNKVFIIGIGLLLLWLFGQTKKESINKKLSRLECLHILNYYLKDYLPKIGYESSTNQIDIRYGRGCDWIEGNTPVYHFEVDIKYPLGKKERLLVRMQSQDTDNSIAGNIISVEEVDYKLTGEESVFKEYLLDMKYTQAFKKGVLRPVMQDNFMNAQYGTGDKK